MYSKRKLSSNRGSKMRRKGHKRFRTQRNAKKKLKGKRQSRRGSAKS